MPILEIKEEVNAKIPKTKPVKETMDKFIPDIVEGVSRRNGGITLYIGSGGSGKTSHLLGQMKTVYKKKFHHIWYFCPVSSFLSVEKHPFEKHDKVMHELTAGALDEIKDELTSIKEDREEDDMPEYSLVIIDDFANDLKDKHIVAKLNGMLVKARHLNCHFIFTVQSYLYFPKILRKQLTWVSIFSGVRNKEEWSTITKELLKMNDADAKKIYDYVFDKPYQHLDIDCFEEKIYKNGNNLEIKHDD
jgi:CRISPR/Cas system-associated endoribonuclease Cas2